MRTLSNMLCFVCKMLVPRDNIGKFSTKNAIFFRFQGVLHTPPLLGASLFTTFASLPPPVFDETINGTAFDAN